MRNIVRISPKVAEWCDLMNYDITKVKVHMSTDHFDIQKCETKEEMDNEGVEYDHPYVLFNPFSLNVKK